MRLGGYFEMLITGYFNASTHQGDVAEQLYKIPKEIESLQRGSDYYAYA